MSELQYTCVRCEGDYLPLVDGLCTRCVKARFRELESRPTYDPATEVAVSREDAEQLVKRQEAHLRDMERLHYGSFSQAMDGDDAEVISAARKRLARLRRALVRGEES